MSSQSASATCPWSTPWSSKNRPATPEPVLQSDCDHPGAAIRPRFNPPRCAPEPAACTFWPRDYNQGLTDGTFTRHGDPTTQPNRAPGFVPARTAYCAPPRWCMLFGCVATLFETAESLLGLTTQLLEDVSASLDPFVGTDTLPGSGRTIDWHWSRCLNNDLNTNSGRKAGVPCLRQGSPRVRGYPLRSGWMACFMLFSSLPILTMLRSSVPTVWFNRLTMSRVS